MKRKAKARLRAFAFVHSRSRMMLAIAQRQAATSTFAVTLTRMVDRIAFVHPGHAGATRGLRCTSRVTDEPPFTGVSARFHRSRNAFSDPTSLLDQCKRCMASVGTELSHQVYQVVTLNPYRPRPEIKAESGY